MNSLLLTSKEASSLIGVSVHSLNNSRNTGKLLGVCAPPHIKIGHSVRYRREALEQWLSSLDEYDFAEGM